MKKQRIVLLTVWFPPTKGVAVNRMAAFAKYLGEAFDLEVITLGELDLTEIQHFGRVHFLKTSSIWGKIAHKTSDAKVIHHAKTVLKLSLHKLGRTPYRSWQKKAEKKLSALYAENPFELIISSYAPVEAHEAAYRFLKDKTTVHWIADMRDEMSKNPFLSEKERQKLRLKEQMYSAHIDAISTVSAPILEDFKKLMPEVRHFVEVRNGYDHDVLPSYEFNERFTVVYAGTFYGKLKPDIVLQAVHNLIRRKQIEEDLDFRFIGTNKNFQIPVDLVPYISFFPKMSYEEAIREMAKADCNLLVLPPMDALGRYSGKVFDYISVGKPVLAAVDMKDVAAELIIEHNAGIACDFYSVEAIEEAFLNIYGHWKRREPFPIRKEKREELHRRFQVEKIRELVHQILAQ